MVRWRKGEAHEYTGGGDLFMRGVWFLKEGTTRSVLSVRHCNTIPSAKEIGKKEKF
jgi:hypothetical protein